MPMTQGLMPNLRQLPQDEAGVGLPDEDIIVEMAEEGADVPKVDEDGNIKPQGIDTSFLVATLTAALQEAHGLIKDLQTRVAALES